MRSPASFFPSVSVGLAGFLIPMILEFTHKKLAPPKTWCQLIASSSPTQRNTVSYPRPHCPGGSWRLAAVILPKTRPRTALANSIQGVREVLSYTEKEEFNFHRLPNDACSPRLLAGLLAEKLHRLSRSEELLPRS